MNAYVNIGNRDFQDVLNDTYVDKSMLIAYMNGVLNTTSRYMCVTRARRFGKSLAAKMLCAYYDDSADSRLLFTDLKIAQEPSFEKHMNQYPVIYLDVTRFTSKVSLPIEQIVPAIDEALKDEVRRIYSEVCFDTNADLQDMLRNVVGQNGKKFIMIVDEWDAICRECNNDDVMRQYVNWLRGLFKAGAADRVFAGVYMTGILPIKQYDTQSALNNFEEFSMVNPGSIAGYFGFTRDEVHGLAKQYGVDEDEIKQWYDGYQIGKETEIYNPFAVMRAIKRKKIASYWTSTTTYENLKRYISMNYEGLRDSVIELLAGNEVRVDVKRFANDIHEINSRDAVLTLLIHLGYLSYNDEREKVRIPNYEVQREFERTIEEDNWEYVAKTLRDSEQLLEDTLAGKTEAVESAIDAAHQENTSILKYNDENSLACVLSLAYVAARKDYMMVREMPSGRGFADIVLVPRRNVDRPAVVIELKKNHSAASGLEQIKEKMYAESLNEYVGEVVLVGISYNEKTKEHQCEIERMGAKHQIGHVIGQVVTKPLLSRYQVEDAYSLSVQQVILLLETLRTAQTARQMRELLGRTGATYFQRNTIRPMIDDEVIAPVKADVMNSPKQKYYITPKGLELLKLLK